MKVHGVYGAVAGGNVVLLEARHGWRCEANQAKKQRGDQGEKHDDGPSVEYLQFSKPPKTVYEETPEEDLSCKRVQS